jgi:predicted RNA-binding Zn ribbon-like protein
VDWLVAVRLVSPHVAVSVLASQLEAVRDLRELTHRLVQASQAGAEFDEVDLAPLNNVAMQADLAPQLRWIAPGSRIADVADQGVRTLRVLVAVRRRLPGRPTVLVLDGRCGPGCFR